MAQGRGQTHNQRKWNVFANAIWPSSLTWWVGPTFYLLLLYHVAMTTTKETTLSLPSQCWLLHLIKHQFLHHYPYSSMTLAASNMGKACANMLTLLSFVSVTRSQLFGYDCMSNPDVFSCEPGPIMNQWKVHFTLASVCKAFLLYYFIELWSWLVEISFHTYSLSPRAVWLSLWALTYKCV